MMEVWLIKNVKDKMLLPVPPSDIEMSLPMNHEDGVMSDGQERTFMSGKGQRAVTINSFFPRENTYYTHNIDFVEPRYQAKKIEDWMSEEYNNRITLLIIGERNISMQATIRNFTWRVVGGAVGDIEYSLEIKEYQEAGYKMITKSNDSNSGTTTNNMNRPANSVPKPKTYVVKAGDTLSKISLSYYGTMNNWNKIYEANKKIIGPNENLIKPGQQLVIP